MPPRSKLYNSIELITRQRKHGKVRCMDCSLADTMIYDFNYSYCLAPRRKRFNKLMGLNYWRKCNSFKDG